MFSIWVKFLELDDSTCPLMTQLQGNKSHWKAQLDVPPAVAATPVAATAAPTQPTTNVPEEKLPAVRAASEHQGDGSNKVAPAP